MPIECKGTLYTITNPLTGKSKDVCFEDTLQQPPKLSVGEPGKKEAATPPVNYQYGPYCSAVSYLRDKSPVLTQIARAYDPIFEAAEKVDAETLSALGDAFGLEDSPHWKWWLVRGGLPLYLRAAGKQWKELAGLKREVGEMLRKTAEQRDLPVNDPQVAEAVHKDLEKKRGKLLKEIEQLTSSEDGAVARRLGQRVRGVQRALQEEAKDWRDVGVSLKGGGEKSLEAKIDKLSGKTERRMAATLSSTQVEVAKLEEALKREEALLQFHNSGALRRMGKTADVFTFGAYDYAPFRLWLSTWLSLSQVLRGPDEMLDSTETGRRLEGNSRLLAYGAVYGATFSAAVYMVNKDYSTMIEGGKISGRAQLAWTLWWLGYTFYQYGRVDQREALRIDGLDPDLADNPLNWSLDNHNFNRFHSSYTSWAADAVYWSYAPRISKGITNALFHRMGHPGYSALPFTPQERQALLTAQERTYLERAMGKWEAVRKLDFGTPLQRTWIGTKFLGRAIRTATWERPSRLAYTAAWFATNLGLVSIPLSRVMQYSRSITEGNTLGGVTIRPIFSGLLNQVVVNPRKFAGVDSSAYGFFSPGMVAVVYPWDGCNEIPTAAHQLALTHLERYRWQTDEEGRKEEKESFRKYFERSDPEDRENDISKYREILADPMFYDLFPEFPKVEPGF